MRWRWIGLAVLGSVGYWLMWGPELRLVKMEDEDGDENLAIVVGVDDGTLGVDEEEGDEGDTVEVEGENADVKAET